MPKRMFDSGMVDDPWFYELDNNNRSLWLYLLCKCDASGFWKVNNKQAESWLGYKIDINEINTVFNTDKVRIEFFDKAWLLKDFIYFQYSTDVFESQNIVHKRIVKIYEYNYNRYKSNLNLNLNPNPLLSLSLSGLTTPCSSLDQALPITHNQAITTPCSSLDQALTTPCSSLDQALTTPCSSLVERIMQGEIVSRDEYESLEQASKLMLQPLITITDDEVYII